MKDDIVFQRWLALGLVLLILLIIVIVAIVPLASNGLGYYEQRQELLFRLEKSKRIVARKESVMENIESIKQQYTDQNYFSTQNTVALASADLQKFIKSTISAAGGQLTSTQVLPSKQEEGFNKITLKVRMSGDVEILRSVLHEIESSSPIMIVTQLDIRPVRGKRNRKTRKIEPSNKLNINFQAIGFMRARPS